MELRREKWVDGINLVVISIEMVIRVLGKDEVMQEEKVKGKSNQGCSQGLR